MNGARYEYVLSCDDADWTVFVGICAEGQTGSSALFGYTILLRSMSTLRWDGSDKSVI